MVAEFQKILKNIVLEATDISEEFIYCTAIGDNEYNTPPWVSLLPEPAVFTPAWHWDNVFDKGDSFIKVQRKWDVVQPMMIHIRTTDRYSISLYIHKILKLIPGKVAIHDMVTTWDVVQTEHIFAAGELDIYAGVITVHIEYGVYWNSEEQKRIEKISFHHQ
ncbi:hypothetical protein SAMN02745150_01189 [Brevinema andersonii]|uniref:Uncharacterized protein n=1 Tax=Brevinema andersonii TaxID=34097 RepID=A0A1I1EUB5_BREAD|nr:hypothetical protein [Brevinema andersonii]SFB88530.1 hypothetical protein SAMN02745150_01189 [Brevinema andersonii]